jgi:ATP-dependent exoDNAse (exonuclease V) beta subunit
LRAVIEEAVDTVLAVRYADFWRSAKLREHAVETPFTVAEGDRALLSGVIDLLYGADGGWRAIDYKTDVAAGGTAAPKYAEQLAAYERALRACGLTSARGELLQVRHGMSAATGGPAST